MKLSGILPLKLVSSVKISYNCCQKSEDLDKIVEMIKQKLVISSRTEKIKLLTLTPPSWTTEQTTKYFGVKKCMVKKARELLKKKGLLCEPD